MTANFEDNVQVAGLNLVQNVMGLSEYAAILQDETDRNRAAFDTAMGNPEVFTLQSKHPEILEGCLMEIQNYISEDTQTLESMLWLQAELSKIKSSVDQTVQLFQERVAMHNHCANMMNASLMEWLNQHRR